MLDYYSLDTEIYYHKNIIDKIAKKLKSMHISEKYRVLFLAVACRRGLRDISEYEDEIVSIATLDCDIIALLLKDKVCGIDTLYKISLEPDVQKREEVYKAIKNSGVKNVDILKLLMSPRLKTLYY